MKKLVAGIFFIVFFGGLYYMVERFVVGDKGPKTQQELDAIAETKYYKNPGDAFEVSGFQITVRDFELLEKKDTADLSIHLSVRNIQPDSRTLTSSLYQLHDDGGGFFYSDPIDSIFSGHQQKHITLHYELPERILPYFLYRLYFEDAGNPNTKTIVVISKSFRSQG